MFSGPFYRFITQLYRLVIICFHSPGQRDRFATRNKHKPPKAKAMKTKAIITTLAIIFASVTISAQEHPTHIWEYQGKKKTNELGLYAGLSGTYAPVLGKSAGFLGARAGLVFNQRWTIGLAAKGLAFDHTLNEVVSDGDYRLEGGYAGMYVEFLQPVGDNLRLSLSLMTANGIVLYRYDKQHLEGKEWYEETIDQDTYGVMEPGFEILVRVGGNWWIGAKAAWRSTSPLELKGTGENILEGNEAGLSVRYGIF